MYRSGFTLVEIMIVIAIVGMLAVIAMPLYVRARETSQMQACVNNLKQIDGAKDRYALENKKVAGDPVLMTDIIPYFMKKITTCPGGGSYEINPVAFDPTCSIGGDHTF